MNSTLTKEQRIAMTKRAQDISEKITALEIEALNEIKSILKTCEDFQLNLMETDDNGAELITTIPTDDFNVEVRFLETIMLDDDSFTVVVRDDEGDVWYLWETSVSANKMLNYILDIFQMEEATNAE